jgi:hypothetical protein
MLEILKHQTCQIHILLPQIPGPFPCLRLGVVPEALKNEVSVALARHGQSAREGPIDLIWEDLAALLATRIDDQAARRQHAKGPAQLAELALRASEHMENMQVPCPSYIIFVLIHTNYV